MRRLGSLLALVLITGCASVDAPAPPPEMAQASDPHLWLEEIDGERALAWVATQNERTRRELASDPMFEPIYRDVLAALDSSSRIPSLSWKGQYLYNLWRDAGHPRGLYRRTTVAQLRSGKPEWTTVLDIDAMSKRDGRQWVFKGMSCLPPEHRQCLVSLSAGGGDAAEVREFDAGTLRFVENGFSLPAAKSNVSWIDADTLYVATDFGGGSLTESGYPRIVKIWKRGTPLSAAKTIHEGSPASVSSSGYRIRMKTGEIDLISEGKTFWTSEVHQWIDGRPERLELPPTADVIDGFRGRLVVRLHEDWTRGTSLMKAGSIVLADPAALRGGIGEIDVLLAPTSSEVVQQVDVTDDAILVTTLDNVRGRLYRFWPNETGWTRDRVDFPDNGSISIATSESTSGDALVMFETFTEPPALYHVPGRGDGAAEAILSQAPTFEGDRYTTTQQWAVSADGTRVPYFVVASKAMKRDGSNPVHIFSYGGFRSSLTPSYSGSYEALYGSYGKAWLDRGGVFVLANIRGGAEFGPTWHSSALKGNREKVFEDFEAVAAHLVSSGITRSGRIGIEGRSNGGLLTLATMIRRPELYGAVISGVPLSDMMRYHELLAGASWMAEYGDPRIPAEREWLSRYSPYQNLRSGADYPPVFVFTSTRDDRVHPGHARKTVARLLEQGHDVWYYENTEGGHGGSSTNEQLAYRVALSYVHLWRNLK